MLQSKPRTDGRGRRNAARVRAALRLAADLVREFLYLSVGTAAIVVGLAYDSNWAVGLGVALLIITITHLQVVTTRERGVLRVRVVCPT
jgi:protein-S-isoprenylcysteine O-methyltransferase Ste14